MLIANLARNPFCQAGKDQAARLSDMQGVCQVLTIIKGEFVLSLETVKHGSFPPNAFIVFPDTRDSRFAIRVQRKRPSGAEILFFS